MYRTRGWNKVRTVNPKYWRFAPSCNRQLFTAPVKCAYVFVSPECIPQCGQEIASKRAQPQHMMARLESGCQRPPRTIPTLGTRTTLVWTYFALGLVKMVHIYRYYIYKYIHSQIHCLMYMFKITIFRHTIV